MENYTRVIHGADASSRSPMAGDANSEPAREIELWSMRQARSLTDTPDRAARNLVREAVLPASGLSSSQVLALRCLHVAESLPADGPLVQMRRRDITHICHQIWQAPLELAHMLVTANSARVFTLPSDGEALVATLTAFPPQAHLLLPVGAWRAELRERMRVAR